MLFRSLGAGKPIVLCAVDWIAISNGGHDAWRESLAAAVGTTPDRVTVHVLHQHDGVRCDFSSEELLAPHALTGKRFDVPFVRQTIANAAAAAKKSLEHAQPVTHLGIGEAPVEKVASNRRILGPNGKVAIFNALNANPVLAAVQTYGPTVYRPNTIMQGRLMQFGANLVF